MKASELREKDLDALGKEMEDLLRDQFNFRMQHATGQLGQNSELRRVRRSIARVKTVMNEKQKSAK